MQPTNHLRFLQRDQLVPIAGFAEVSGYITVKMLQQWWANDPDCYEDWVMKVNGEWRDVALEIEQ